jgi:hypothetical protein
MGRSRMPMANDIFGRPVPAAGLRSYSALGTRQSTVRELLGEWLKAGKPSLQSKSSTCQSAPNIDPGSARNSDLLVAAASERAVTAP